MRIKTLLASMLLAGCSSFGQEYITKEHRICQETARNAEKLANYIKQQGLQERNGHTCRYVLEVNADGVNYIVQAEEPLRASPYNNRMLSIISNEGMVIDFHTDGTVDVPASTPDVQNWYQETLEKLVENCR